MARRSYCCISSSSRGGSLWPNGCRRLLFVGLVMLCMVAFLPCEGKDRIDGIQNALLYDGCESYRHYDGSVETKDSLPGYSDLKNVCFQSTSLFFPSTLIGLGTNFDGLHSEKKNFDVDNVVSCKKPPLLNLNLIAFSSKSLSSPYVEIIPPLLDWGTNSLFTPSLVHLTVGNMHNSSVLHVFEPFCSDGQFYAYGFERLTLAPGETGSVAFVFLPRTLGSVMAHVVLQTSFGGFVIHAKGVSVESPYGLEPFRGFELLSDGRLSWNLSLYNTFDDVLYVEEVTARISIYSENGGHTHRLICSIEPSQNSFSHLGSFCKIGEREVPWMEIRPHKHWEVPQLSSEIIMKMNLWPPVKGNISGIICIKLQNFTQDKFKRVILPLEAEVDINATYRSLTGSVSLFFEPLVPWDGRGFVCTLSIRNTASHLLSVVSIRESSKVFEVKYMERLLLYPETITNIALISYNHPDVSKHIPPKIPWVSSDCKLSLLTNDSISPQIEISCEELVKTCCRHQVGSGLEPESSFAGLKSQAQKLTNARTGSLNSIVEEVLPPEMKFLELLEADRIILRNWRSQGTMSKLSVLKDQELLFPVVQIGTQFSKWITVHNPSQKPVIMQLVLNSGAIIDHCKTPDDSFKPSVFSIISAETQDGFSIPETTTTEAVVHPFGSAQIGPVLFRPSKRCAWRSSALIRNNLSGVEWLSLRAFGGSHSLLLLEGSDPVKKINFNLDLPTIHNPSSPNLSFQLKTSSKSCVHQLYKELYAKNAGELPLEVMKLEVSGTDCGSDGFMIHDCKGFSLAPGESKSLLISYRADFSAALVQRHVKLAMETGFLVIPMEARLPVNMMDLCKNSLLWTVIWKLPALIFAVFFIVCILFFLLHPIASGSKDYSVKSENTIAVSRSEKPSRVHRNTRNARSIEKNGKLEEGLVIDRYSCCEHSVQENSQIVKEKKDSDNQNKSKLQSPPPTKIPVGALDSSETSESPRSGSLTVKVVKERGRRRKRRAAGGGLALKFEVSSSQSGNSTPSSPMSPNGFTPNSSFSSFGAVSEEQSNEKKQEFSFSMEPRSPEPQKKIGKPVLLTSATFPGTACRPGVVTSNFLVSSSPIAPYARAPGSKLSKEKGMKTEEDEAFGKEYTYDIWGNHRKDYTYDIWGNHHFCGHLMGKPKELSSKVFDASEGDSQSFFTRDPQSLMMMSSAQSESSGKNGCSGSVLNGTITDNQITKNISNSFK